MLRTGRHAHVINTFRQALKSLDLKATPQRIAVHEAMMELGHASADMVLEHIRATSSVKVTAASVYNILTQLSEEGIYSKRMSPDSKMYFDFNTTKHLHLFDTKNKEFRDVDDDGLNTLVENYLKKRKFRGYKVDGIDILILCHPTRKKSTQEPE